MPAAFRGEVHEAADCSARDRIAIRVIASGNVLNRRDADVHRVTPHVQDWNFRTFPANVLELL